jgi:IMP dehydrogenase
MKYGTIALAVKEDNCQSRWLSEKALVSRTGHQKHRLSDSSQWHLRVRYEQSSNKGVWVMAFFYDGAAHTFNEYLLVPGYSSTGCVPSAVDLSVPLVKYAKDEKPPLTLNIPLVSAIMQSVSNDTMAIALAREGGLSFIYSSQSIESQATMIARVKDHKAGFVESDSNVSPNDTLETVMEKKESSGHSTMPVTHDGSPHGKLLGIVTSRDYRPSRTPLHARVSEFMTPRERLIVERGEISLGKANDTIWEKKLNALPVVDENDCLLYLVFRKDYDSHKENPLENLDGHKRYVVGAGVNTHDYEDRVGPLLAAGADVLCIDSSEGYSEWQKRTLSFIKSKYGSEVKVGAGNVVDREGFRFLADAGADFIKVGIGGGSICITREQKGIGRGQATSIIEVADERNAYFKETGIYVPICSDGGIVFDYHMTLALAMGADFMMLGRYFARFDESPTAKVTVNGNYMKEYWGEGSARARNWQRYHTGGSTKLSFEEGVDSYVPYAGPLKDNVALTLAKVRSTMCNCGALSVSELQERARLTLISSTSIVEGGAHDVMLKDQLSTLPPNFR